MSTTNYDRAVCPCKGCQFRCTGCHSRCERYQAWQKKHIEDAKRIARQKRYHQVNDMYFKEACRRVTSNQGHDIGIKNARKYRKRGLGESTEMEADQRELRKDFVPEQNREMD